MDIGRRSFLRGALLTSEGRAQALKQQHPLGPFPPWMGSLAERSACTGCNQPCVSACGQGIIRIHSAGHALAGFPWLDFSHAGCTFCGDCVAACPVGFLKTEPARLGTVTIDHQQCLAATGVSCITCIGVCPARALQLALDHRVAVDKERCTGCGVCVGHCPVQALTVASNAPGHERHSKRAPYD